ncbi:MAG: FecR family protein [Opitutales bacterium]
MPDQPIPFASSLPPAEAAAAWLARLDRGATETEQREFSAWLEADPRHAGEYTRLESEWKRLDRAGEDPVLAAMARELDARSLRRSRWRPARLAPWAAAAAIVLAGLAWWSFSPVAVNQPAAAPVLTHQVVPSSARQLTLPDGSVVALRGDSEVATDYTPAERRVRLLRGEAHFIVAKNPDRPFIVSAGGVAVRAVGTAFDVRLDAGAVEVLVTEGKVGVNDAVHSQSLLPPALENKPPVLSAGQRVTIEASALRGPASPVRIDSVTAAEMEQTLAWQSTRLVFNRTPLSEAVSAFNQHETHGGRLVLGSADVGERLLGGTFRADNVEGFIRLLELSADVRAERRADGTVVLWPTR